MVGDAMVAAKLAHELPSVERLQEALRFDLEAGKAYWLTTKGGRIFGSEACCAHRTGYIYAQIDGCRFSLHRAIWAVAHGRWPSQTIDHIDGNVRNNAISNLREAAPADNWLNRKTYKNNKSGVPGVYRVGSEWRARIRKHNVEKHLGTFKTFEAAVEARQAAAAELFGEYSRIE